MVARIIPNDNVNQPPLQNFTRVRNKNTRSTIPKTKKKMTVMIIGSLQTLQTTESVISN